MTRAGEVCIHFDQIARPAARNPAQGLRLQPRLLCLPQPGIIKSQANQGSVPDWVLAGGQNLSFGSVDCGASRV
jgi:hypothetical protein